MQSKIFIYILVLLLTFGSILAQNPQLLSISDPKVNVIKQIGDSIWAAGCGISVVNSKTKQLTKLHQNYMQLAAQELSFFDIAEDSDGLLFASNRGIWILKDSVFQILNSNNSPLPSDYVNCIAEAPDGVLWIGTDKGIVRKNGDDWITDNFGIDFEVRSITFDMNSDSVYLCSDKHYYNVLADGGLTPVSFPLAPILPTKQIMYRKVLIDRFGIKWAATYGTYGLLRIEGENVTQLLVNSANESIIDDINFDENGDIIGICGTGYFTVNVTASQLGDFDDRITSGVLGRALTAIRSTDGTIWFGGTCPLSNRVAVQNPIIYVRYNNALMPGPFLNAFHPDTSGWVFLSNYNGLGIFDTQSFVFYDSTTHSSKITGITDISYNNGNLILVSYNQVYKFQNEKLTELLDAKFKTYSFYGSSFDSGDTLWLTTRRAIWKYYEGKIDSVTIPGPSDNYCFTDILCDKNNTKWIKTLNGFYGYRDGFWSDSVLPADVPVSIRTFEDLKLYSDYEGNLWFTSIKHIFRYDSGEWTIIESGVDGVPEFASRLDRVPTISFVPGGKQYLCIDEKIYILQNGLWLDSADIHPFYEKTYKLFVDVNDNKWIYKTDAESIAITMFREWGVYNSAKDQIKVNIVESGIYPNPATDCIIIGTNNRSPLRIESFPEEIHIFDVLGNCVLTEGVQNFESLQKINISALSAGVYFVRIGGRAYKFVKL